MISRHRLGSLVVHRVDGRRVVCTVIGTWRWDSPQGVAPVTGMETARVCCIGAEPGDDEVGQGHLLLPSEPGVPVQYAYWEEELAPLAS